MDEQDNSMTRISNTGITTLSEASLSPTASKLVGHAVTCAAQDVAGSNRLIDGCKGADDAAKGDSNTTEFSYGGPNPTRDSTQIILPVNPIPKESELRIGKSASFVKRHTFPIESDFGVGGLHIHRNPGSVELDVSEVVSTVRRLEAEGRGDLPENNEFLTLIDEMASQVAKKSADEIVQASKNFINEIYKRISDVATKVAANSQRISVGGNDVADTATGGMASGHVRLPPEVKERVLRTLSDVKNQLEMVKNKLRR